MGSHLPPSATLLVMPGHGAHGGSGGGGHGHEHDRGLRGFVRYVGMLPRMWRSPVSGEVVAAIAPVSGERVVDLGAGMGPATVLAAKTGASVLAVDPTPYMRRILAGRRLAQRGRSRIEVAAGSAEVIPTGDQTVDAVFTVNTMHHWVDMYAAIHELARVLRPGGRLLLVDEDFGDPTHPAFTRMRRRRTRHEHHFADIDPDAVATKLSNAGFTSAEGAPGTMAGRPVRLVRAVR